MIVTVNIHSHNVDTTKTYRFRELLIVSRLNYLKIGSKEYLKLDLNYIKVRHQRELYPSPKILANASCYKITT